MFVVTLMLNAKRSSYDAWDTRHIDVRNNVEATGLVRYGTRGRFRVQVAVCCNQMGKRIRLDNSQL